ncbi:Neuropeptide FF receptor 2 [Trichoplax sp. H2]|nr:Neuropeptide FF receptor 2 [Trichoplax sp. H2]|eukprot:RDD45923.1 Neuropeptide FF receptor 2 [Trichoplax sp. H2]
MGHQNNSLFLQVKATPTPPSIIGVQNWEFVCFTILYSITFILSLFGNSIMIISIIRNKTKNMRGATNYFIANLAFSDLLIAIFVIPYRYNEFIFKRWQLGRLLCALLPTIEKSLFTVSILQILAIAYARHRIVVFPFKKALTKRRAAIIIFLVWIVAISGAIPVTVKMHYDNIFTTKRALYCAPWWSFAYQRIYYRVLFFLNAVPMFITFGIYGHVYYVMRRRTRRNNSINSHNPATAASHRSILKMLLVMLLLSSLCWIPYGSMIFVLSLVILRHPKLTLILSFLKWLAVFNCCHNPFVCWIFSQNYRQEMIYVITCDKRISVFDRRRPDRFTTSASTQSKSIMLSSQRSKSGSFKLSRRTLSFFGSFRRQSNQQNKSNNDANGNQQQIPSRQVQKPLQNLTNCLSSPLMQSKEAMV